MKEVGKGLIGLYRGILQPFSRLSSSFLKFGSRRRSGSNDLILQRRSFFTYSSLFAAGIGLTLLISACNQTDVSSVATTETATNSSSPAGATVVQMGYQKASFILLALKQNRELENRLKPLGISVEWNQFPSGPKLLEGMSANGVDFGYVAPAPPISAQAAGVPLVYTAGEPLATATEAILIPKDSPIQKVEDLKGKKVAFNKGSNVQYVLAKAVERVGLKYSDVQPVFLPTAEGRSAFERGDIDAWVIWDPFLTAAQKQTGARVLVDGKGLMSNGSFYIATRSFVEQNPDTVKIIVEELEKASICANKNKDAFVKICADSMGMDTSIMETALSKYNFEIEPITSEHVAGQQKIADTFYSLKLIPEQIKIEDAVLK